jgi:hypothetical protein
VGAWHIVTENLDQPCKSEIRKLYTICFSVLFFFNKYGWLVLDAPKVGTLPPLHPLSFRAQSSHTVNFQLFGRMVGGSETLLSFIRGLWS